MFECVRLDQRQKYAIIREVHLQDVPHIVGKPHPSDHVDVCTSSTAEQHADRGDPQLMSTNDMGNLVSGIDVLNLHPPRLAHTAGRQAYWHTGTMRYTVGMHEMFRRIAHATSEKMGSPWAFGIALGVVLAWACVGPLLDFSTSWQLFINTTTTILTFLMVFLIQNTQNRDSRAVHLKLDELIRAVRPARDMLIDIEDMEDEELVILHEEFRKFRDTKVSELRGRRKRTTHAQ